MSRLTEAERKAIIDALRILEGLKRKIQELLNK